MVNRKKPILCEDRATFAQLMRDLQNAEECNKMSDDEYDALIGQVTDKVDAIREVISRIDAETERLKLLRDEFHAAWKSSENNGTRLRNYIMFCLKQSDLKAIHGDKYSIKLVEVKGIGMANPEPNDDQYIRLSAKYPGIIKRTLAWDKKMISDLAQGDDPEDLRDIWNNRTSSYIKFGVNKNGK